MSRVKAGLDRFLAKVASRKLIAWLTSTVLVAVDHIDPDAWVAITCVYVGTQGVHDVVATVLASRGHKPDVG